MINLMQYIHADLIIPDLQAKNKEEAIEILLKSIYAHHPDCVGDVSQQTALSAIFDREKAQTTGLGEGMAFPHARVKGWKDFIIAMGYSQTGVNFNSLDQKPAQFICLMISSTETPYMILKIMSNLIKLIGQLGDLGELFRTNDPRKIETVFRNEKAISKKIVEAQDIMRPLKTVVAEEDYIETVIKLMHLRQIDVLPVVDEDGRLKGQISCFNIFEREIPDFFKQLHTVSFVRNIDPFEKFFVFQKELKVKDFLKEECATVDFRATLLEVIFLLTTKAHPRLFVLENEKLVGVIDRFSILDRILFF